MKRKPAGIVPLGGVRRRWSGGKRGSRPARKSTRKTDRGEQGGLDLMGGSSKGPWIVIGTREGQTPVVLAALLHQEDADGLAEEMKHCMPQYKSITVERLRERV